MKQSRFPRPEGLPGRALGARNRLHPGRSVIPILIDYGADRLSDTTVTLEMTSPTPVGGWNVIHTVMRRFGGLSGLILKSCSSGFSGVSGITITDSGNGRMNIQYAGVDTSGMGPGVYAHSTDRVMSGQRSCLARGFLIVGESIGA